MKERGKLEKVFTIFGVIFAALFISSILLVNFGIIRADKMIQGCILAFMIVSVGITSLKSSKLLGITCFVVSFFIFVESIRLFDPITWYKF